ncbi:MAG TPA: MFS transporter [Rhizomicrobium sp.]|nr:MFS transporter [Rhizomicrobium sp.]
MRKQLFSIGAILFSAAIFIAGNGLIGTLIPVRAHLAGFSTDMLGLVGSFYYVGFVAGCFAGPRLLARVGHSRTFAVCAGIAAATTLFQSIFVSAPVWILMRAGFGFAAASLYMVIESWLNERAEAASRGRIFATYMTINYASMIVGQMLFSSNKPTSFTLFDLTAALYALCLIPVGLTLLPQPQATVVPTIRPLRLYRISPVGVMGCTAVGLANSAVWAWAPIFAQDHGLTRAWLSTFMCMLTLGGALVQLPLGRLSDHVDRRYVILGICVASAALGVVLYEFAGTGRTALLLLIGAFGITALPFYGLSVAHANDRIPREGFVEASATLLMINALAACFGPTLAAQVIQYAGSQALFLYTATIHVAMAVFVVVRLRVGETLIGETKDKFEMMPPQSSPAALELDPRGETKAA